MDQKLETFLTLCKTMHYGRAAELLHLSQPAVSKHIQALEAQYGVRLFTYQARRLQKTREGDLLEQYAFSLRYNEEMLLARLHEKSKTLLRIGATKSIGDYILLPEIRRFLAKPDQQLRLRGRRQRRPPLRPLLLPPAHRGARTECRLPQKYGRWALGASVSGKVTEKNGEPASSLYGSPFTVCPLPYFLSVN